MWAKKISFFCCLQWLVGPQPPTALELKPSCFKAHAIHDGRGGVEARTRGRTFQRRTHIPLSEAEAWPLGRVERAVPAIRQGLQEELAREQIFGKTGPHLFDLLSKGRRSDGVIFYCENWVIDHGCKCWVDCPGPGRHLPGSARTTPSRKQYTSLG
jgi:hypothetical protein